jgi:ATP-dependent exoDNAse (exonuclease V) beta subunit
MSINEFYAEPEQEPQPTPTEQAKKAKTVSFSQYAMWLKCPMQWKLSYIDKLAPYEASIHTVFGTGIHEALQEYLRVLYTEGATQADAIDTFSIFKKSFEEGLKELKIADEEQSKLTEDELDALGLTTSATISEFENDGKIILDHVLSYAQRSKHFPSKKYDIVGIELPLEIPMRNGNILYKGFLDIVLKEKATGKILILDFKTSTRGWNKYQKADRTKIDQLLLYKRFYHQTFKIPMSDIEVEFFVVKRKLLEDVEFPQQRIQRISPPDGKTSMREVETAFLDFINNGFDAAGEYNKSAVFLKNPGKARKNCKYCVFKTLKSPEGKLYCDGKEG